MTYVSPKSRWYSLFCEWFVKKKSLGLDRWGNDIDPKNAKLYTDLEKHFLSNIPEKHHKALCPHNWTVKDYLSRVTNDMLFNQYAQHELGKSRKFCVLRI